MAIDWRKATADQILARLPELDEAAFEEAAPNEALTEEHVRLLLKDTGLASEFVERISREPRFFKSNSVRVALALHPKLPRVRGLEILRHLYWRDLLRVSASPRVHPQLRAMSEQLVADRIPDLTLGERIAVARTCGRGVLRALRTDPSPRVVEGVLRNFRCTEEDALFMASSPESRPDCLTVLARHPKWRMRPAVRYQLVRNRRLPLPVALGLLPELGPGELESVGRRGELPRLLRASAERLRVQQRARR